MEATGVQQRCSVIAAGHVGSVVRVGVVRELRRRRKVAANALCCNSVLPSTALTTTEELYTLFPYCTKRSSSSCCAVSTLRCCSQTLSSSSNAMCAIVRRSTPSIVYCIVPRIYISRHCHQHTIITTYIATTFSRP